VEVVEKTVIDVWVYGAATKSEEKGISGHVPSGGVPFIEIPARFFSLPLPRIEYGSCWKEFSLSGRRFLKPATKIKCSQ
jgi:hypothetical protein